MTDCMGSYVKCPDTSKTMIQVQEQKEHTHCGCDLKPSYTCHEDQRTGELVQESLEDRRATLTQKTTKALIPDLIDLTVLRAIEAAGCCKKISSLHHVCTNKKEQWSHIEQLPVQDALWIIRVHEKVCYEDGHFLRVMVIEEVHGNKKNVLQTNIGWSKEHQYKTQLIQLVCHACLHPQTKSPRKPRFIKINHSSETDDLSINLNSVGIHIFMPHCSDQAIANAQCRISDKVWFRCCNRCGRRGTPDMFISCPDCDAVLFCDEYCRDSADHSKWCPYFKVYMQYEEALGEFPFSFTGETTDRLYNVFKNRDFLKHHNIYGKGIWRRECKLLLASLMEHGYGDLEWLSEVPYGLSKEDAILQQSPEKVPSCLQQSLKDWAHYYDFRGFSHDSPIAGVLHYALTLYGIIVTQLPHKYPAVYERMNRERFLCVHVIGAAKEADMWHTFLECARLLKSVNLHICFIGNEISQKAHGNFKTEENLYVTWYSGLYHRLQGSLIIPQGNIVVCYNAGLSAYESYKSTIELLISTGVPTFCTDYCLASYEESKKCVRVQKMAKLSEPSINPFRSPLRMVYTDIDLPRYSNAILFTVAPYCDIENPKAFVRSSFIKNHSKMECTSEVYKLSLLPDDL